MDSGQKVKLHYQEMAFTWPWRSGSTHLIQSVEPVGVVGRNTETPSRLEESTNSSNPNEVVIDGRHYMLRHDANGKLKVTELREVQ